MGKVTQRLLGALDVLFGGAVSEYALRAAIGLEGTDQSDEGKYRKLGSKNVRDLPPLKYQQIQKMAFYQWQRYPLATALIEILLDFLVGEEFQVKVKIMKRVDGESDVDTNRLDAQQGWDDFFKDPINKLKSDFSVLVQDLLINGELVLPVFVNEVSGKTRIGYIDPAFIVDNPICVPMNAREIDTIVVTPPESVERMPLKVIRYDADPKSATYEKLVGDAFYFRINYVTTQTRGNSELMNLLDLIDTFDQFVFSMAEGFNARNSHFYDLTLTGASDPEVKAMAAAATSPTAGELKVHNEKAIWEVKTPDLKAVDASAAVNLLKTTIVGMKGWPAHWFGDGSDANLATAGEMAKPTVRKVKRKQSNIKSIVEQMALFVEQQLIEAKIFTLADDEYIEVETSMFDIEKKDSAVVGAAMTAIVNALAVAETKGWVSSENAKKVVDGFMNMLGITVDPNETPEDLKAQANQKNAENAITTKVPVDQFMSDAQNQTNADAQRKNKTKNQPVDQGVA
jgi:hypothetical protein